jgi:hypothetical protein
MFPEGGFRGSKQLPPHERVVLSAHNEGWLTSTNDPVNGSS